MLSSVGNHSMETGPRHTKKKKISSIFEKVNCVLIEQRRYFRYITIAVPLLHFIIYPVQKFRTSQTHTVQLPEL